MAAWPTLKEVRTFLRLQPDSVEDGVISSALAAAVDYGNRRTNYKYPPAVVVDELPDVVHQACLTHAAKLYRRRDSIDGTLGFGDMGVVRVARSDPDIEGGYATVGPLVFG